MELIMNRYVDLKYKVKTKISYGLPVFPIYFSIYINEVFLGILTRLSQIIYLLFMNYLVF